jgi:hypothetical protein
MHALLSGEIPKQLTHRSVARLRDGGPIEILFLRPWQLLVAKGSQRAFTSIGIRPGLCGIAVPRRCRRDYSFGWLVPTLPAEAKELYLCG